jgi:hypothetical protein
MGRPPIIFDSEVSTNGRVEDLHLPLYEHRGCGTLLRLQQPLWDDLCVLNFLPFALKLLLFFVHLRENCLDSLRVLKRFSGIIEGEIRHNPVSEASTWADRSRKWEGWRERSRRREDNEDERGCLEGKAKHQVSRMQKQGRCVEFAGVVKILPLKRIVSRLQEIFDWEERKREDGSGKKERKRQDVADLTDISLPPLQRTVQPDGARLGLLHNNIREMDQERTQERNLL